VSARTSTVPREVPTYRQGVKVLSPFRAKVSQKWKELMDSRASLSMLVTLEERERLKELSRWSNGLAPRGGHTDRRTVRRKQREVKHLQSSNIIKTLRCINKVKKLNRNTENSKSSCVGFTFITDLCNIVIILEI